MTVFEAKEQLGPMAKVLRQERCGHFYGKLMTLIWLDEVTEREDV
jgi:hypothetical protein